MSLLPVFNTPVESALRSLVLLVEIYPEALDLQQIVYLEYLLVHSSDADGPASLHPATPRRSGELVVRRELIERGINLLLIRGLAEHVFSEHGIGYKATELAGSIVSSLSTSYSSQLRDRARWLAEGFGVQPSELLDRYFRENLDRWGGEFIYSYGGWEDETA